MSDRPFGARELYEGSRFLAPLSEEALLEAGRAADLHEGATLLAVGAGNGCAAIFLAEAFHAYARCVEEDPELLELAREHGERSPARRRLRFTGSAAGEAGPFDCVASLCAPRPAPVPAAAGRLLLGRFDVPPALAGLFPAPAAAAGRIAWRRDASPLEWERFLVPLERALRRYRDRLRPGDPVAPLALHVDRQISAFRAHATDVRYELVVVAP